MIIGLGLLITFLVGVAYGVFLSNRKSGRHDGNTVV